MAVTSALVRRVKPKSDRTTWKHVVHARRKVDLRRVDPLAPWAPLWRPVAAVTSALVDNATRTGSTGSTSTVSGASFGAAGTGRVLCVQLITFTEDITAVTIGGISATLTGFNSGNGNGASFIASAVVPAGTSGNIVATLTGSDNIFCNGVVALTGANNATPSDTIINNAGGSGNIDVGAAGSLVAFSFAVSAGSWTGATGLRTDSSFGFALSTASFDNGGGALTNRAVSYSGGLILIAAAFDASGGGGGVSANPTTVAGTGAVGTPTVSGKANVPVTGNSATGAAGTPTVSVRTSAAVTGNAASGAVGDPTITGKANVTPPAATASGAVGTPTVAGAAIVSLTGVSASSAVNALTVAAAANVDLPGVSATGTSDVPTVVGKANLTLDGVSASGQAGTITVSASGSVSVSISGIEASLTAGAPAVSGAAVVSVTGIQASGAPGSIAVSGKAVADLSGVQADSAVGSISIDLSGAVSVVLTGVFASGLAGILTVADDPFGGVTNPLENLKMYTGSLGAVSNREDWIVNISFVGSDGTDFDLSGATEIETFICKQGCPDSPVLTATLDDGITLLDQYTMQWVFSADEMASLCAAQYDVFSRVVVNGITTQTLAASVPIVEGGPR